MTSNPSNTLGAFGEEPATIRCGTSLRATILAPHALHCRVALEIWVCWQVVVMTVVLLGGGAEAWFWQPFCTGAPMFVY
jgi:hypothetical protein